MAIGALDPWAFSTSFIILDITVSFPTAVASIFRLPFLFILAPYTTSPAALSIGILSPVSIDSSTVLFPSITFPSTGILSPGFTKRTSPFSTSSISTCTISPFLIRLAFLLFKLINFFIASEVFPLLTPSRYFPKRISARITTADSSAILKVPYIL